MNDMYRGSELVLTKRECSTDSLPYTITQYFRRRDSILLKEEE